MNANKRFGNWQTALAFRPGTWALGLYWQNNPASVTLMLPLATVTVERSDIKGGQDHCWSVLRVGTEQELQVAIDLHSLFVGTQITAHTWSLHLGPLTIGIEWNLAKRTAAAMARIYQG